MERTVPDVRALEGEAADFVRELRPRVGEATLVTLSGELGAGKTAFVQAAAKALGIEDAVTSPTFVLQKAYELPRERGNGFMRLVHIDAYRLESGRDLLPLRFEETLTQADNLVMLEWPERVADALPPAAVAIAINVRPDGARTISYV